MLFFPIYYFPPDFSRYDSYPRSGHPRSTTDFAVISDILAVADRAMLLYPS